MCSSILLMESAIFWRSLYFTKSQHWISGLWVIWAFLAAGNVGLSLGPFALPCGHIFSSPTSPELSQGQVGILNFSLFTACSATSFLVPESSSLFLFRADVS
jgi:hypothetical protein